MNNYYNALGYGFWCGKKCASQKQQAGIPPLGGRRQAKQQEAEAEQILAQAVKAEASKQDEAQMSPLSIAGTIGASLLGITLMVVIIRKTRNK